MNWKIYYAAFKAQITSGVVWDLLPLVIVLSACIFWIRKGKRVNKGRIRAALGLAFLLAATMMDWTDEWFSLTRVPILGRGSVWHEPFEDMFYLLGIASLLSHWKSLIRYH